MSSAVGPRRGAGEEADEGFVPSAEQRRRQRARSWAIALALGALVVLFYVVTIVKLGSNVMDRPL